MGRLTLVMIFCLEVILPPSFAWGDRPDQEVLNQTLRQMAIDGLIPGIVAQLKLGAKINSRALHGETALEYAIRFGRTGAALKLLELGADPNAADDSGLTPLHRAAGECDSSRVVDALLRAGAKVNARDYYGRTPLMNAAHGNCIRSVAVILLRAKDRIDLDARDDALETAYDFARAGYVPTMLKMIEEYRKTGSKAVLTGLNEMQ
jgi:cytohesin